MRLALLSFIVKLAIKGMKKFSRLITSIISANVCNDLMAAILTSLILAPANSSRGS